MRITTIPARTPVRSIPRAPDARRGGPLAPLRRALADCHVPLDRIPPAVVEETLAELPAYARRHNLPFGIAHVM